MKSPSADLAEAPPLQVGTAVVGVLRVVDVKRRSKSSSDKCSQLSATLVNAPATRAVEIRLAAW